MVNGGFLYVGLMCLCEKKEFDDDGVKKFYYEIVETPIGFYCEFENIGKQFLCLTGKLAGSLIKCDDSDRHYIISNYKSFHYLAKENGEYFDPKNFIDSYKKYIGKYYTYREDIDTLVEINDSKTLEKIKGNKKTSNAASLDSNTDIAEMYRTIKKTIISQDEPVMQILTSIFKNQKVINSSLSENTISKLKENILVYGATGTGKTEILKRIAEIYNVPIVIEDATSFSETGFKGRDITDMLKDLYLAAGKNLERAEKSILVIDEFDKLSEKGDNEQSHVSKSGVQRSLLKLLDGTTFYFDDIAFNTSKLTIVALGAFTGIAKDDDYSKITQSDFVNYGIIRELIGRFSKPIAMNPLHKDDIKKILLESDFSPLNTYKELFDSMNVEFSYDDDFLDYIAEKAVALDSGARSLKTIFDEEISDDLFKLFAKECTSIHLTRNNEEVPYVLKK